MSDDDASSRRPLDFLTAQRILAEVTAPDEPDDAELPRIDGYRLVSRLGAGSGGTVYKAFHHGSERAVALKVLGRELGAAESQRSWRELDAMSQVHLAAVPRVLDYGTHQGRLYIASEFVEGLTLDAYCHAHSLDRRQRVRLLAKVADAVGGLHEHGVIHRDIKPGNVLIDIHGEPVIIDLGIASLIAADVAATLTADGAPLGTPAFMAPEQARGQRSVSTRSDVYALGAAAFLVLTGDTPHDLDDVTLHEAVRRVTQDEPRHPRSLDPSLPRALAAVLAKACARAPDQRYGSAADFAADLRRWSRGEHVHAVSPGPWVRATRWLARHPILATAGTCIAIAAATLAGTGAAVSWLHARPSHLIMTAEPPHEIRVTSQSGRVFASWPCAPDQLDRAVALDVRTDDGRWAITLAPGDGRVHVYRWGRFDKPVWSAPSPERPLIRPSNALKDPDWGQTSPGDFTASRVILADVFPHLPGPQVAVAFTCSLHPSAFRIYTLAGDLLYEAWHPGNTGNIHWVPDAGLLVACGAYGELKQAWLDVPPPGHAPWPLVAFALRPRAGVMAGWVAGREADPAAEVAWYKFLCPYERSLQLSGRFAVQAPRDISVRDSLVELVSDFGWWLDERGERVHATDSDVFNRRFGARSDDIFYLSDTLPQRFLRELEAIPGGPPLRGGF